MEKNLLINVQNVFLKDAKLLGSTSNMIGHLRDSHHVTKSSLNMETVEDILKKSKLILSCALPLSIVNNEEFKIFCNSLDPKFKVPIISIIKTMILMHIIG